MRALWLFPLNLCKPVFGKRLYFISKSPKGREFEWWVRKDNWFTRLFMTYFAAGNAVLADEATAPPEPSARLDVHEGTHIDDQHVFGGMLFLFLYFVIASPWGWLRGAGSYEGNWLEARAFCAEHGVEKVGFWAWFKKPKAWTPEYIRGYARLRSEFWTPDRP